MYALALALCLTVPADDDPPPDLTVQWLSSVNGQDDFFVRVTRLADGTLETRWHDEDTGLVRYKGVLTYDAKAGEWKETYDPEWSRCGDWRWHGVGEVLRDHNAPRGWVLRRPGKPAPDL